jgi:RNA polymerase sigma-B factor
MARRPQDETIDALFAELHATGSSAARQALIERYLPLARSLAARYSYTPQPLDDLVQVASLGLVKAVDAFDPSRGADFAAFAVPTIIGELKRHMRDSAWAVHVPRALKEKAVLVERVERTLAARSGASPTVDELAAEADLGVEEVLDALSVRLAQDAVPLDTEAVPGANADLDGGGASSDRDLGAVDDSLALASAFRRLRPRERTILRLRIVDGLTQTEIAAAVGLSQMYVSRLLRATLESLRSEIDLDR